MGMDCYIWYVCKHVQPPCQLLLFDNIAESLKKRVNIYILKLYIIFFFLLLS